ncbi:MAG: hypothetical protein IJP04_06855, partial [Clostridia bacterium]|nr:hypothetical protein [Clostridia bacterium]
MTKERFPQTPFKKVALDIEYFHGIYACASAAKREGIVFFFCNTGIQDDKNAIEISSITFLEGCGEAFFGYK